MRDHDLLLEWASERGSGTWSQFRTTWEWICARRNMRDDPARAASIAATDLAALGHLELSWEDGGRWAVAPPIITMLPDSGGRALITGARTRALYQPEGDNSPAKGTLADAVEELQLWIDEIASKQSPTSVLIACNEPGDAEALAARCSVGFSYSVSDQLSAMLPGLQTYIKLFAPCPLPQGYPVEKFLPETLAWQASGEEEALEPGLYRAMTYDKHIHIFTTAAGVTLNASREHAIYELLRWEHHNVLRYDAGTRELWVPARARLPVLQSRAAVLCSGQIPRYRNDQGHDGHYYVNVPPVIAERVAASLCQELQTDA